MPVAFASSVVFQAVPQNSNQGGPAIAAAAGSEDEISAWGSPGPADWPTSDIQDAENVFSPSNVMKLHNSADVININRRSCPVCEYKPRRKR